MEISYKLKKLRSEKHMTQQEVAEKLCVTRQAVSNWETGKTQPDFDMLRSIAEIYCVSLNDLFGSEDSQLTGDDSLMTHIQKEDSNTKISKKNLSKNKYPELFILPETLT